MVSFCCDACQDVVKKPSVLNHFSRCGSRTVSCIDCGVVFNRNSVRQHTSCVSEAEKHGPKGGKVECTQTYCGICKLRLNGAIHALQHYDSKKHRASERKAKAAEKGKAKAKQPGLGDNVSSQTVRAEKPELLQDGRDCEKHALLETAVADAAPQSAAASRDTAERSTISPCGAAPVGSKTIPVRGGVEKPMKYKLNRAMKQVLKDAPKQKLKRGRLIAAVSQVLGGETPDNIGELLNKRVRKSKHFEMRKDRIFLIL